MLILINKGFGLYDCAVATPSNLSQTYVKFVNLVQAVRQKDRLFTLDPVDERVLSSFATVWGAGKHLTATEAALIVQDVAPRTVQRRVAALIDKGMLRVENDSNDNRIKYLLATDKTNKYFAELGKCLEQAKGA
jgi:predicted transcriptional regulator